MNAIDFSTAQRQVLNGKRLAADHAVAVDAVADHGTQRAADDAAQHLGTARRQHIPQRAAGEATDDQAGGAIATPAVIAVVIPAPDLVIGTQIAGLIIVAGAIELLGMPALAVPTILAIALIIGRPATGAPATAIPLATPAIIVIPAAAAIIVPAGAIEIGTILAEFALGPIRFTRFLTDVAGVTAILGPGEITALFLHSIPAARHFAGRSIAAVAPIIVAGQRRGGGAHREQGKAQTDLQAVHGRSP